MKKNFVLFICLFGVLLILGGCSFSRSSKASSRSSSSPSRSSSGASESAQKTSKSYQEEVMALAILYANSGGSSKNFQSQLGAIAQRHSLVDWENDPATFNSIGKGLQQANVERENVYSLPFLQGLRASPYFSQIFAGYN